MRTETTTRDLFQFEELDETTQSKALDKLYSINVEYVEWWDFAYEDAKNVLCKIEGFDLGRGQSINFSLEGNLREVCEAIISEHGKTCDTYKLAKKTLNKLDVNEALYEIFEGLAKSEDQELDNFETPQWGELLWDKAYDREAECEDLEVEFQKDLGYLYWKMLSENYDYYTSEEAIKETIEANEYEFDIDGNLS